VISVTARSVIIAKGCLRPSAYLARLSGTAMECWCGPGTSPNSISRRTVAASFRRFPIGSPEYGLKHG